MGVLRVWNGSGWDEIKGERGDTGASAYQIAVNEGFVGTEEEWLESLEADPIDPVEIENAVAAAIDEEPRISQLVTDMGEAKPAALMAASRVFDVRDYGAIGDGVADDTAALIACAADCVTERGTFFVPAHLECKITSTVNLRYVRSVQIEGTIRVHHTSGPGLVVGLSSAWGSACRVFINVVFWNGTQTNPTVQVVGMKNGHVTVLETPYMQLFADGAVGADASNAYSHYYLGKVDKLELDSVNGSGWINENVFHSGRVNHLIVKGSYGHNNNMFNLQMEGSTIDFLVGNSNKVYARWENSNTINMSASTWLNRFVQLWGSNETVVHFTPTFNDLGRLNTRGTIHEMDGDWRTLWAVNANAPLTNSTTVRPGHHKVRTGANWLNAYDSGIVPVAGMRIVDFDSDASVWRLSVTVYNASRVQLTDGAAAKYILSVGCALPWNSGSNVYVAGTELSNVRFRVVHPDVAYIKIRVNRGGSGSNTWFEYAHLLALVTGGDRGEGVAAAQQAARVPLFQSAITAPTESILPLGTNIATSTGMLILTARVDRTASGNMSAGATSATLDSGSGISNGDKIAIALTNGETHFASVTNVAGNVVTWSPSTPSHHTAIEGGIITQRWIHIT